MDVKTASDAISRMSVPTCILQMQVQENSDKVGQTADISNINVELSKETLDTMLDGLSKIRDQLSSVAKRWWKLDTILILIYTQTLLSRAWQTLSHKIVLNTPRHEQDSNSQCKCWPAVNPTTILFLIKSLLLSVASYSDFHFTLQEVEIQL